MRNIYRLAFAASLLLGTQVVLAQNHSENVGIGTTVPDRSAILDLSSSDKGLLIPRMTSKQREAITNPAQGLILFQTDEKSGFYFYSGEHWQPIASGQEMYSTSADPNDWTINGNSVSGSGSNTTAFLGTTNNRPLIFKVNNERAGYISSSGNLFLGINSGLSNTTGYGNLGFGRATLNSITTGYGNLAIGSEALTQVSVGINNVAIGRQALEINVASHNLAIGKEALAVNTTGDQNVAIGLQALYKNVSGAGNFGAGTRALGNKTSGDNNLALGYEAGLGNINGSSNVFIGYRSGQSETGSNKLYIANNSTTTPLIYGDFSAKFISIGDVSVSKRNTASANGYGLLVKGGIITEKIKVALMDSGDWADYVFEEDYERMSLEDVEEFVKTHKHLPKVPSAEQMAKEGMDVHQTSKMFMEKIEELTLYMIDLNKEVKALKAENADLRKQLNK